MNQKGRKSSDEKIGDLEIIIKSRRDAISTLQKEKADLEKEIEAMKESMCNAINELDEFVYMVGDQ